MRSIGYVMTAMSLASKTNGAPMTPERVKAIYYNWMMIYETVHGPLLKNEREATQELVAFIQDVVRAECVLGANT